jgi:hypothetical protein
MKRSLRKARKQMDRLWDDGDDDPALSMLVGDLAGVFRKHFRMEPTVAGPSGEDITPFIAFVIAVCKEQDMAVTPAKVSDCGRRVGVKEDDE